MPVSAEIQEAIGSNDYKYVDFEKSQSSFDNSYQPDDSTEVIKEGRIREKRPMMTETAELRSWRIANLRKFYPGGKYRQNNGKVILGTIFKDKPWKISLSCLFYSMKDGKGAPSAYKPIKFSLSLKNGFLNLYRLNFSQDLPILNKSTSPNLAAELGIEKDATAKRLARVINIFLKENQYPRKLKIKDITAASFSRNLLRRIYYRKTQVR